MIADKLGVGQRGTTLDRSERSSLLAPVKRGMVPGFRAAGAMDTLRLIRSLARRLAEQGTRGLAPAAAAATAWPSCQEGAASSPRRGAGRRLAQRRPARLRHDAERCSAVRRSADAVPVEPAPRRKAARDGRLGEGDRPTARRGSAAHDAALAVGQPGPDGVALVRARPDGQRREVNRVRRTKGSSRESRSRADPRRQLAPRRQASATAPPSSGLSAVATVDFVSADCTGSASAAAPGLSQRRCRAGGGAPLPGPPARDCGDRVRRAPSPAARPLQADPGTVISARSGRGSRPGLVVERDSRSGPARRAGTQASEPRRHLAALVEVG